MAWPVNQNRVRESCGSILGRMPNDHGSSRPSASMATPTEATNHRMALHRTAKACSGMRSLRLSFRHDRYMSNVFSTMSQVLTTTSTRPK